MNSVVELVQLFARELDLCKLESGEHVGIYTEGGRRREYADAFAAAAGLRGAEVFVVDLPLIPGRASDEAGPPAEGSGLARHPEVLASFEGCDLLIDLTLLLWTPEMRRILESGTRVISCIEPVESLRRMFPTVDQRRRSEESEALIKEASELRVTNDAGSDLVYQLGDMSTGCQYGFTDTPGRWDHFASTLVGHCPNEGGVSGTLVLQPGDALTLYARFIEEPVRLTIEDGFIRKIEGGYDAGLIERYISRFDEERAYAVSHIGWGLNENARFDAHAMGVGGLGMEARSYIGNVMFSVGPNIDFGGSNDTSCHIDIPMLGCTLELDGDVIVDHGRIVKESLLPAVGAAMA